MHRVTPCRAVATALNTKLLPPPVGRTHSDLIASPFIPDSISSAPTTICHGWGVRLNVLTHLSTKSAVYWSIGGVLDAIVSLLLDLNVLCDGSAKSVFLVAVHRASKSGGFHTNYYSYLLVRLGVRVMGVSLSHFCCLTNKRLVIFIRVQVKSIFFVPDLHRCTCCYAINVCESRENYCSI